MRNKKSVIIRFSIKVVPTEEVAGFMKKSLELKKPHLPTLDKGDFKGVCLNDIHIRKANEPISLDWIIHLKDVATKGEETDYVLLVRDRGEEE